MGVTAFAKNAPDRIAGQYPRPRSTRAASANPVGGHTGEIDAPIVAYLSPRVATTK
jgi:hypothetical protein